MKDEARKERIPDDISTCAAIKKKKKHEGFVNTGQAFA